MGDEKKKFVLADAIKSGVVFHLNGVQAKFVHYYPDAKNGDLVIKWGSGNLAIEDSSNFYTKKPMVMMYVHVRDCAVNGTQWNVSATPLDVCGRANGWTVHHVFEVEK